MRRSEIAFLVGLAVALSLPGARTNAEEPARLFPVIQNGKWGYIDGEGRLVIQPKFNEAIEPGPENIEDLRFSEGLALAMAGERYSQGKWGYIDKTGNFVIKPRFDRAWPFSEERALVRLSGGPGDRHGYIDRAGKLVIKPRFKTASHFSEGRADVSPYTISHYLSALALADYNGPSGYVDKDGRMVIKARFITFNGWNSDFSNGLAHVGMWAANGDPKWGYIDTVVLRRKPISLR